MPFEPIADIDLSDPAFWDLPMASREGAFARLRAAPGLPYFDVPADELVLPGGEAGQGYYAVTRHKDVLEANRHAEVFRSSPSSSTIADPPPGLNDGNMISLDNPQHARLRTIVSNAYHPTRIAQLEAAIDAEAAALVGRVAGTGDCDFVSEVAAPFPLRNTCLMMGIPESSHAEVLACANTIMVQGKDPAYGGSSAAPADAVIGSFLTLAGMIADLGAYRVEHPSDDVTTALVNADIDGERLTTDELAAFFILLVIGGIETTVAALAHGLDALTRHPEQKALWQADPDGLAVTAANEIVRWATPAMWFRRTVAAPVELGGTELAKGDKVLLFYSSANRDDEAFADAEVFDVTRSPNPHVGFGGPGEHFCLGAHLARRELGSLFRELFRVAPGFEATGEPVPVRSSFYNGIRSLPCRLG